MINILNQSSARDNALSFFPELGGAQRSAVSVKQLRADHPEVSDKVLAQMAVAGNTLNPTSATLWSTISDRYVDAARKRYVDLRRFAYAQAPSVPLPTGVRAPINVPVIESAGPALVNTTDWDQTAISQSYATILADRISRPFALDSYDLASGERVEQKIGAAIESVVAGCWAKLATAVQSTLPSSIAATTAATSENAGVFVTDSDTWGPDTVAKEISTLFGDFAQPDVLALSPTLYGGIVPTNALSLNPETEGVYGIRHIAQGAGMPGMATGNAGKGFACRGNAIGVATMLPYLDDFTGVATRYLGEHSGIPMLLKLWDSRGTETLRFSVETIFGAKVLAPQFLTVLV